MQPATGIPGYAKVKREESSSHRGSPPSRERQLPHRTDRPDTHIQTAQPSQAKPATPSPIPAGRARTTPPRGLHTPGLHHSRQRGYLWGLATAVPLSGARCTSREGRLGLGAAACHCQTPTWPVLDVPQGFFASPVLGLLTLAQLVMCGHAYSGLAQTHGREEMALSLPLRSIAASYYRRDRLLLGRARWARSWPIFATHLSALNSPR